MVYICGDFNIDLLHCEEQTESKHFLDQMFSSRLHPLVTSDQVHDTHLSPNDTQVSVNNT